MLGVGNQQVAQVNFDQRGAGGVDLEVINISRTGQRGRQPARAQAVWRCRCGVVGGALDQGVFLFVSHGSSYWSVGL